MIYKWVNLNLPNFKESVFLILTKIVSLFFVFQFPYKKRSYFVFDSADSQNYITGSANIFKDLEPNRLPAYSLIIKVIRLFSDSKFEELIILSQVICGFISVFIFYALIQKFISKKISFLTSLFFAFVPYFSFYDLRIMTETYSTFFILLTLIFYHEALNSKKRYLLYFFLSGLFLSISAFLKTIYFPLVFLFFLILFFDFFKIANLSKKFRTFSLVVFLTPFLIFEIIWVSINYLKYKEIIFISKLSNYQDSYESMENYYGSMWLFSGLEFDQNNWENISKRPLELKIFPFPPMKFPCLVDSDDMKTEYFNLETLKEIQKVRESVPFLYSPNRYIDKNISKDSVDKIIKDKKEVFNKMTLITESLKKEHPFKSMVLNKVSVLFLTLNQDLFAQRYFHQPPFAPFNDKNNFTLIIKVFWNISYSLSIALGLFGSISLLIFSKNIILKLLSLLSFYLLFIYIFSWLPEWRYIMASLPIFIMLGGIFIEKLVLKLQKK